MLNRHLVFSVITKEVYNNRGKSFNILVKTCIMIFKKVCLPFFTDAILIGHGSSEYLFEI